MPLAIYDEWRGSSLPGGINFVISPFHFNPLVKDKKGTIVYAEPQLYVDGVLITASDPIIIDYLGLTCVNVEGKECNAITGVGTGPFQYRYPIALNSGKHDAKVQWEAYDGEIFEYSWSFTLTD